MVITSTGSRVFGSCIQGRYIGRNQCILLGRDVSRFIKFGIETCHYLEVMPIVKLLKVVRIDISGIVILFPRIFVHARRTRRITTISHVPYGIIRISFHVIGLYRKHFPVLVLRGSAHTSLQVDFPVLDRFEYHVQLVGEKVLLAVLLTAVLHLFHFAFIHRESVRVVSRMYRPFTRQIVEELTGQVRRTIEILARPFSIQSHLEPICHRSRNLRIQRIALEVVRAMVNQTVLVQETAAHHELRLFRTTVDTHIMLVRRCPSAKEFVHPVGIAIGIGPLLPDT